MWGYLVFWIGITACTSDKTRWVDIQDRKDQEERKESGLSLTFAVRCWWHWWGRGHLSLPGSGVHTSRGPRRNTVSGKKNKRNRQKKFTVAHSFPMTNGRRGQWHWSLVRWQLTPGDSCVRESVARVPCSCAAMEFSKVQRWTLNKKISCGANFCTDKPIKVMKTLRTNRNK